MSDADPPLLFYEAAINIMNMTLDSGTLAQLERSEDRKR